MNDIVAFEYLDTIFDPRTYVAVLDVAGGGEGDVVTRTYALPDETNLTLAATSSPHELVALADFACRAPCDDACTDQCLLGGCMTPREPPMSR